MEQQTNINGLNIRYKMTGEGNPVVLLHGWGCDLHIFEKAQKALSENFLVYAIDFPGFGESDDPNEVWGVEEYTRFIEDFFKAKNIDNPVLIGHSFGGRVSILFASRNETKKIVLVGSAGVKPKKKLSYYFKVYSYKSMKALIKLVYGQEKGEVVLEKYRSKKGSADYQNTSGIMRKVLVKIVNEDLKEVMPKIKAPSLLLWGENDDATPVADAKIMEQLIPNAGLVVLKNAGHYCFLEKSTEFLIIVNNFLGK